MTEELIEKAEIFIEDLKYLLEKHRACIEFTGYADEGVIRDAFFVVTIEDNPVLRASYEQDIDIYTEYKPIPKPLKLKVGDSVVCKQIGKGVVESIITHLPYPIRVKFDSGYSRSFTETGLAMFGENPVLSKLEESDG